MQKRIVRFTASHWERFWGEVPWLKSRRDAVTPRVACALCGWMGCGVDRPWVGPLLSPSSLMTIRKSTEAQRRCFYDRMEANRRGATSNIGRRWDPIGGYGRWFSLECYLDPSAWRDMCGSLGLSDLPWEFNGGERLEPLRLKMAKGHKVKELLTNTQSSGTLILDKPLLRRLESSGFRFPRVVDCVRSVDSDPEVGEVCELPELTCAVSEARPRCSSCGHMVGRKASRQGDALRAVTREGFLSDAFTQDGRNIWITEALYDAIKSCGGYEMNVHEYAEVVLPDTL